MKGLLSSPRRRRRLAWLAILAAVAAAFTVMGVFFSNTSPTRHGAPFTNQPVDRVAALPASVEFTKDDRREVDAVAGDFIQTAVFRRRLDHAYDLVLPDFRQGLSRKQWRTGNIPVVPYPRNAVALMRWKLDYSYRNRVGLHVAFMPKQTARVAGMVFAIELEKVATKRGRHWLVSYWTPTSAGILSNRQRAAAGGGGAPLKPRLSAAWIFVPIGSLIALIVLVPTAMAVRGWRARARAARAYGTLSH
jgi:hypothetical protein